MFLSLIRIIKFSFQDIFRNIWLSAVTVIILILMLFSVNMILVVQIVGETAVTAVKEKVDVSLYLKPSASEDAILALKDKVRGMRGVRDVEYISRQDALDFFRDKYKDKPEVLDALQELGKNPLNPSLVIKPENSEDVNVLTRQLNNLENDIIESRDFSDHRTILGRINSITDKVSKVGIFISLIFFLTTVLVVFNSIRVAIYTHRREIAIMKLVGASNPFVYMPFVFSGLIYAIVGVLAVIAIFYPFLGILQPYIEVFFIDFDVNVIGYFNSNFIQIFGLQFILIAFINIVASLIAVRKYAKV